MATEPVRSDSVATAEPVDADRAPGQPQEEISTESRTDESHQPSEGRDTEQQRTSNSAESLPASDKKTDGDASAKSEAAVTPAAARAYDLPTAPILASPSSAKGPPQLDLSGLSVGNSFAGVRNPSASRSSPASRSTSASRSRDPSQSVDNTGGLTSPSWLGKRVGRFRLIGLIGRGANGKVFRAEDIQLHRLVALKVISSRSGRRRTAAEKKELLLREARSAAKLEHPNIVAVYEAASQADIHFIAMELVEGGNLKDLVVAAGPLDIIRACQLGADAAEALQHAHEHGVIHRDVKPANLMLARNGRCKLADFGLARLDDPSELAEVSGAVGTPQYVAPEIVQGHEANALSDVYSLGATLFFLLTGAPPFPGDTAREVIKRHIEETPPDVRTLRPDVPQSLALTIWRAMAKEPTARHESAGHFARALRMHTIGSDVADRDEAEQEMDRASTRPSSWSPRHRALALILGGGVAVVLVFVVGILLSRSGVFGNSNATAANGVNSRQPLSLAGGGGSVSPSDIRMPVFDSVRSNPPPAPAWRTIEEPAVEDSLPLPGTLVAANDTPTLLRVAREPDLARHDGRVKVEGYVTRARQIRSGEDYAIDFKGVDRKLGLSCTLNTAAWQGLRIKLRGDPSVLLVGRKVRISGKVELSGGQPLIEINEAGSIDVPELPATPAVMAPTTRP